jgi:S-adenosylmethionine hydrolase
LLSEVTWVDRFGNCQLNVGPEDVEKWGSPLRVIIGASDPASQIVRSMPVVRNFADIGGGIGLVVDSYGMLALCVDRGSASAELQLGPTDMVMIAQDPSAGAGVATSVRLSAKK